MEKRKRFYDAYTKTEARSTDDGKKYIEGFIPYNSESEEMWGFVERIAPGAFKRTLNGGADIFAFWAHDDSKILGSRNNNTVTFTDDPDGLRFSIEVRDTEVARDYYETVARGDCNGVSFGFFCEQDEWDHTQEPALRTLKQVRLLEVSPGVAFPAYPGAQSDAARRSLYEEGAPEFRSKFMKTNSDQNTPDVSASTPGSADQPPEAREQEQEDPAEVEERIRELKHKQQAELGLLSALYGISLPGDERGTI